MGEPTNNSFVRATKKVQRREEDSPDEGGEDDIELKEGDVRKEIIDSVPSIDFFDRVFSLIQKIMENTLVVKFLGRKIGPWVVFAQYLMVQPWSPQFTPLEPFPHNFVAWMRILVDLLKLLVSKLQIAKRNHRVEYESLPTICFHCGTYGHMKDDYPQNHNKEPIDGANNDVQQPKASVQQLNVSVQERVESEKFGDWMVVERRQLRLTKKSRAGLNDNQGKNLSGSRFNAFTSLVDDAGEIELGNT
ncbi:hypothetical protein Godav_013930 [Gossypium davidsonii]|uniref:CCHC-type domain-containing protein n=1 Tax=Gossypium davidsonii TaxID=34287 RepID=A0A7J8RIU7_GOSDV|nr:hypothetical protein [Gossypium davidsonii]